MFPWSVMPERRLAVGHRGGDQVPDPGRPVEHGELGVGVQMRKRPLRHRPSFRTSKLTPCVIRSRALETCPRCDPEDHRGGRLVVQGLALLVPQREEHVEHPDQGRG